MQQKLRVLLLAGGDSPEREVSLASGRAVAEAVGKLGHSLLAIDPATGKSLLGPNGKFLADGVHELPPDSKSLAVIRQKGAIRTVEKFDFSAVDVIFNILHGGRGEDGTIQALLDLAEKPYTGSGVLASALAMNKHASKKLFQAEGIPTPDWELFMLKGPRLLPAEKEKLKRFGYPFVIKPNDAGSTVGLTVVHNPGELDGAVTAAFEYSNQVMAEQFIAGRELTVGVLGQTPLPVVEIIPKHEIYDYTCKYTSGMTEYICPARLSEAETGRVQELGLKAFLILGCEGFARTDFRMGKDGVFYCLEVNTLPGMTNLSLVPKAADASGLSFGKLIQKIIDLALERKSGG
ncbi:MAG: D-alanine--D-alanine ligase [candidate division Zixibacteria bacterium]|nr:D-alanine--D-alanine ligase [candidate division Zixibacteria bacterium]